jgi:hypothetical protein
MQRTFLTFPEKMKRRIAAPSLCSGSAGSSNCIDTSIITGVKQLLASARAVPHCMRGESPLVLIRLRSSPLTSSATRFSSLPVDPAAPEIQAKYHPLPDGSAHGLALLPWCGPDSGGLPSHVPMRDAAGRCVGDR